MLNAKSPVVRAALGIIALASASAVSLEASAAPAQKPLVPAGAKIMPRPDFQSVPDEGCKTGDNASNAFVSGSTMVITNRSDVFYAKTVSPKVAYDLTRTFCAKAQITISPSQIAPGFYGTNIDDVYKVITTGDPGDSSAAKLTQPATLVGTTAGLNWRFGKTPY